MWTPESLVLKVQILALRSGGDYLETDLSLPASPIFMAIQLPFPFRRNMPVCLRLTGFMRLIDTTMVSESTIRCSKSNKTRHTWPPPGLDNLTHDATESRRDARF